MRIMPVKRLSDQLPLTQSSQLKMSDRIGPEISNPRLVVLSTHENPQWYSSVVFQTKQIYGQEDLLCKHGICLVFAAPTVVEFM